MKKRERGREKGRDRGGRRDRQTEIEREQKGEGGGGGGGGGGGREIEKGGGRTRNTINKLSHIVTKKCELYTDIDRFGKIEHCIEREKKDVKEKIVR